MCAQFVLAERGVLAHHDKAYCLAAFFIGHADHGRLQHARMHGHHVFDFVGEDIEAGHQDHVLAAIEQEKIALFVAPGDVAGAEPAAFEKGVAGFFHLLPIPCRHVRAACAQFARFSHRHDVAILVAQADFDFSQGHADGADRIGPIPAVVGDRGAGFRQAVTFDHVVPGHRLPAFGCCPAQGRAALQAKFQVGKIQY